MCDHHQLRPPAPTGEIDHVNHLSEGIGALYLKEEYSDIVLKSESERFYAHKVILAARSEYFRAMLFGGLRESEPGCAEIELQQTNAQAFRHLLKYIYTGKMSLTQLKEEILLSVLELAHQYLLNDLESSISTYLKAILNPRNVCMIYDMANMYSLKDLCYTCTEFMDLHAAEIVKSDAFLSLSTSSLKEITCRVSFCAAEIDIFHAIQRWAKHNNEDGGVAEEEGDEEEAAGDGGVGSRDLREVIQCVRLPLMSLEELLNDVRPSNLVSADIILDAIKVKNESRSVQLQYRGFLSPEENVATLRNGATVLRGEMKASLLDEDCTNYDLDRGFSRHPIDENSGQGLVIKLAHPYIINTVRLLLWDRDMRSYSYYIEVSMDDKDYERVIDNSHYMCRSWQNLHFPERVVKYIRVVGTHNSVNRVFHLVACEGLYTRKPFKVENGFTVPMDNVASISASACVLEGVSRSRNALINGDTSSYDWDSGYTCHQLGSGSILIQLAQPFIIGSFRLLLWDCDGRHYSYYIDVSTDQQNWQIVADKTKEQCRSWQTLVFEPRPITFIRIVGTHNTANEVFHCVHFECPANGSALAEFQRNQSAAAKSSPLSSSSSTAVKSADAPASPRLQGLEDLDRGDGLVLEGPPDVEEEEEDEQERGERAGGEGRGESPALTS